MKADVLNLYQLKVFQLVAQKKLIREVANELQVTASAVSQSLAKLEQDLGTELFVHDVRPLRLTPAGQALLKGAPALLESADLLRRSVTDHSLADISLRLGMSESVTSTISPWLISSLNRCVRELDCVSFLTKPLVEHLRNDQINVAVLPEALLSEDRWERNALYEEDYLLVHAKNGPDFSESNFAAAAAVSPYIGYSRTGSSDQVEIGRILRSLDIRPNQTVEVASSYALVGLVSELNGWTVIPHQHLVRAAIRPQPRDFPTARQQTNCPHDVGAVRPQSLQRQNAAGRRNREAHFFGKNGAGTRGHQSPFGGTRQATLIPQHLRFFFSCRRR